MSYDLLIYILHELLVKKKLTLEKITQFTVRL